MATVLGTVRRVRIGRRLLAASAHELAGNTEQLNKLVQQFKVS